MSRSVKQPDDMHGQYSGWRDYRLTPEATRLLMQTTVIPSGAALVEKAVMHPLDTVIAHQQRSDMKPLQAARHIYTTDHWRGFYRGLTWQVWLSAAPGNMIVYGSYTYFKDACAKWGMSDTQNYLFSSAGTGLMLSVLSTPVESKRVRDTFAVTVPREQQGVLSYHFRGFVPNSAKLLVSIMMMLGGTDIAKQAVEQRQLMQSDSSLTVFAVAFAMGVSAQIITTPFDVVKTKVMADYTKRLSVFAHTRQAYLEQSLWTSVSTRMVRLGFQPAIMFGAMHFFTKAYDRASSHEAGQAPSELRK